MFNRIMDLLIVLYCSSQPEEGERGAEKKLVEGAVLIIVF